MDWRRPNSEFLSTRTQKRSESDGDYDSMSINSKTRTYMPREDHLPFESCDRREMRAD